MSECNRAKSLLKGIMIVFKTKVRKIVALLTGVLGCLNVNRAAKKSWLIKSLERQINSKKRVRKYVAFLTGGEDWLNVNRPAK